MKFLNTKLNRGSFYVEIMIALLMIGILATSLIPIIRILMEKTTTMKRYSTLYSISNYCGSYIFRWVNFSSESKSIRIANYSDGDEFQLGNDYRVNQLTWATAPEFTDNYLTDHYKVSIQFQDTDRRYSAGVIVTVWYDSNLDSIQDDSEPTITFSTLITEKET